MEGTRVGMEKGRVGGREGGREEGGSKGWQGREVTMGWREG